MSVKRLLTEMDSYELSAWQAFLVTDARHQTERRRIAEEDARLERGG